MYFVPIGLLIKAGASPAFWQAIGQHSTDYADLIWGQFLLANLLPVTFGNLLGGTLLVGAVYWFVYLRPGPPARTDGSDTTP
jgi:formate transporter